MKRKDAYRVEVDPVFLGIVRAVGQLRNLLTLGWLHTLIAAHLVRSPDHTRLRRAHGRSTRDHGWRLEAKGLGGIVALVV
jgi:hypothetical protein